MSVLGRSGKDLRRIEKNSRGDVADRAHELVPLESIRGFDNPNRSQWGVAGDVQVETSVPIEHAAE